MFLTAHIQEAGYSEDSIILKDIRFAISRGELVSLIGPNGAGKSTTIKAILGILNYMKGEIETREYSYIPERPIFYERITLWEHIDFLLSTLETDKKEFYERANGLLKTFQLSHVIHHFPESFSKGMQQKSDAYFSIIKKA